ncbi:MAG: winged helix-turn-helix domain-containing protein [Frankiaceae bacterium]
MNQPAVLAPSAAWPANPGTPLADLRPGLFGAGHVRVVDPDLVPDGATVLAVVILSAPAPATSGPVALPDGATGPRPGALRAARVRPDGVVVDAASYLATAGGVDLDLTRREFDLLLQLTAHPGRVYTRDGLMREVWGYAVTGYPPGRTVDVHVARLRRKLGVHATRLETIRGVGYRWRR